MKPYCFTMVDFRQTKFNKSLITLCFLVCSTYYCTCEDDYYDFIVVGAGSAGSVMANRLSENGQYSVLLLEQGGYPTFFRKIPALTPAVYFTPTAIRYKMEVQENMGLGYNDQRMPGTRAKGLGGTSVINYMIFTRGHREDYNRWAALGNPGWSFDEVLPYFKKYENAKLPIVDSQFRSTEGEMDVVQVDFKTESIYAILNGSIEAGIKYTEDYNTEETFGASFLQTNLRNGVRCDAEKAFLEHIRDRKSLKIETNALVTKLLIDAKSKTVTGVEYERFSQIHRVKAIKEVILSAGGFGSPQLLMLSGIGPKEHLEELGIEVIQDLPVGQMTYDHHAFPGLMFTFNQTITSMFHDLINPIEWGKYILKRKGRIATPGFIVEGLLYLKTSASNETIDYPDIEVLIVTGALSTDYGLLFRREFGISDETYHSVYKPIEGKSAWSGFITALHPKSKGYLRLASRNPKDHPKIYGNYLTDSGKADLKSMIAAIRIVQGISDTPSLQKYGSKIHFGTAPACRKYEVDSDDYWECQIRSLSTSYWHNVATCKMGPASDKEAVVDNKLRIHGMKNIRIADTSVIPLPLAAHTNSPTVMVGEKGAAIILKDTVDSDGS